MQCNQYYRGLLRSCSTEMGWMRPWSWFFYTFQRVFNFILMGAIPLERCGLSLRTYLVLSMSLGHFRLRLILPPLYLIFSPLLRTSWWNSNNRDLFYRFVERTRLTHSTFTWFFLSFVGTLRFVLPFILPRIFWVLDLPCHLLRFLVIVWLKRKLSSLNWILSQDKESRIGSWHIFKKG